MKLRCFSDEKLSEILKNACAKESIFWTERKVFAEMDDLVNSSERDEMVAYLLEVCDRSDMSLSIETFSLTVTLLDRFLASFKVKSKYLECLAVSCLYIASKIREEDEKISITSEFLYDCNSKCSVSELLRMEMMILTKFEWSVDDITAADFLYIFHALLVNKYNASVDAVKPSLTVNKWKVVASSRSNQSAADSSFPPPDLDFLHSLEYKLKQLLCNHELATVYKPRVLAFALISIQVEKVFNQERAQDENQITKSRVISEFLHTVQFRSKITNETLKECKEKVTVYLETIDADKTLMDSYMDQYYSEMAKNHRANSRLSITLSAIAKHLAAIKEEDEPEEQLKPDNRVLCSISNQMKKSTTYTMSMASNNCDVSEKCAQMDDELIVSPSLISYADILLGRRDQKRKLSENSTIDDDYEFDCKNRN